MKAFVTGATGFIGRALVDHLLAQGTQVIALVRSPGHGLPRQVETYTGDILDPSAWSSAGAGCDRVYHLAAKVSFDTRDRQEMLRVNAAGTANILEAALCWGVDATVIASSAITMGLSTDRRQLLDESSYADAGMAERNPYCASKLAVEEIALKASSRQKVIIVNPATVYGPGDRTLNSGTLIRKISHARFMPVPAGGGNVVDVADVARGIVLAGEKGVSGKRYILGGENLAYDAIFREIARVIGKKVLFVPVPRVLRWPLALSAGIAGKLSSSRRLITRQIIEDMFSYKFYSTRLAQESLGFLPQYTFPETVKRAWDFYRNERKDF